MTQITYQGEQMNTADAVLIISADVGMEDGGINYSRLATILTLIDEKDRFQVQDAVYQKLAGQRLN